MATVSRSFVENYGAYDKATWTVTIAETGANASLNVSGDFTIAIPTVTAKYVYRGKSTGMASVTSYLDIVDVWGFTMPNFRHNTTPDGDMISWSSGTTKTLPCSYSDSTSITLSEVFTEDNKDSLTLSVHAVIDSIGLYSSPSFNGYSEFQTFDLGEVATITLNAPPIVSIGTPTYATPQYTGLGAYSVPVTSATAQYGGDVSTITLTVGSDSVTQNYATPSVTNQTLSLVPSIAGTYTPTITVTDSRGQVTTVNLDPIIVNAYNVPSVSFDIQRCTNIGKVDVEGECGLVSARISYTNAIANLTQPTITVQDESGTTITSSAIWYTSWTAQSGVQNAVNWTNYNPQSPVTLYGVISATGSVLSPSKSYIISVTPTDNLGGVATTITQTLPSSFFTIDFQAGGKEIAFGAVADDDVTNYPEGLFKCAMSFKLKDNLFWVGTRSEYEQAVADDKMPEHTIVFITDETADYVVEEGTDGIWTYRKWNSGIAECWGKFTRNASLASNSHVAIGGALPTFFINETPIASGSGGGTGAPYCFLAYTNVYGSSGAYGIDCYIRNNQGSAAASQWAFFYAKGKWK